MKPVLLDMDPGVDDALALLLALRSPELDVKAITVSGGNVGVNKCLQNAFKILDVLEVPEAIAPPVAKGAAAPLKRDPISAASVHGKDGLGGLDRFISGVGHKRYPKSQRTPSRLSAVELILETIREHRDRLTIIATGPTTNIAHAIIEDSKTFRAAGELIVMTGAFRVPGNISPSGEFNAVFDPDALQTILEAQLRRVIVVGLDVTRRVILRRNSIVRCLEARETRINRFVADMTEFYIDFHREYEGVDGCFMHDPLAVGVAIRPGLVRCEKLHVQVETAGRTTLGATIADMRTRSRRSLRSNAKVCMAVDSKKFINMFNKRVMC